MPRPGRTWDECAGFRSRVSSPRGWYASPFSPRYGQLSGMVEPLAGLFGAFAVVLAEPILPYALAFAAGAMVYVVMDDIIPEAQIRWESFPSLICPCPCPSPGPQPLPSLFPPSCPSPRSSSAPLQLYPRD